MWLELLPMVQQLSELINKKVSLLIPGGPKGLVKMKGTIVDANDEDGMFTLETSAGGMMGGKKKIQTVFFVYSVLGIEIEEEKK